MSEALLRYADAVRETACHFTELEIGRAHV